MNVFIMQDSLIKPFGRDAQNALIGFVGENNSRTFFIRTRDDLTGYTVSLVIDETDCGAMTKTPMPDGSTMLTLTLTSGMLGQGGNKICQLIMANDTTVKKSSQFFAFVGLANDITQAATDSATLIVISEAITQMISDSIPPDYSDLLSDIDDIKADLEGLDERVEALESGSGGSGLTDAVKTALLQLAQKVAYIDDGGQDYYDDLYNALYPPADIVSISAVYTQSGTVYNTDTLNSLKSDLVVTALMSDQTTSTLNDADYTLSGTLTVGTSTITVSYGGKTTTFTVTVTEAEIYSYSYANGDLIKLVASCSYVEGVGAYYTDSTDNKRRTFFTSSGENTLLFKDSQGNYVDGEYYPIPIPHDATSVSVSITPNLNNIGVGFYTYDETAGTYTRVLDPGWVQGSYTNTFTAGEWDAITVTAKSRFSVAFTESDEPTELTITFSR